MKKAKKHVHKWTIDPESGCAWCLCNNLKCMRALTRGQIERILNRYERLKAKEKK